MAVLGSIQALLARIRSAIYTNTTQAVSGDVVQDVLVDAVETLESTRDTAIETALAPVRTDTGVNSEELRSLLASSNESRGDIAANTTAIATNTANIATNTDAITHINRDTPKITSAYNSLRYSTPGTSDNSQFMSDAAEQIRALQARLVIAESRIQVLADATGTTFNDG